MAGVYRPRHPERTVLYRVLFHYFDRFLAEYEGRFEREYGFFRPIIKEVVERYLDCGNPLLAPSHRGKVRKASLVPVALGMIEEELRPIPSRGWAEMIRKVYEVDPLVCPKCGGRMKVIAFLTDYAVADRIIHHLHLSFVADKPPPPQIAYQEVLIAAQASTEYFS